MVLGEPHNFFTLEVSQLQLLHDIICDSSSSHFACDLGDLGEDLPWYCDLYGRCWDASFGFFWLHGTGWLSWGSGEVEGLNTTTADRRTKLQIQPVLKPVVNLSEILGEPIESH